MSIGEIARQMGRNKATESLLTGRDAFRAICAVAGSTRGALTP